MPTNQPIPLRTAMKGPLVTVLCLLLLSILAKRDAVAQPTPGSDPALTGNAFIPNLLPQLDIPRITTRVNIDGILDEEMWQRAAVATNFSETFPNEKARPPIGIKAFMAYDSDNLYVAYVIEDDPAEIRVNMSDRDQIWQDDYAGMLLDPNGDGQVTYFISANALGIQGDTRSGNGREDVSFDLIYTSAGKVTDTGYQIEMAIPFRSLRFPKKDVQEWKATFWITRPREHRNTYSWSAIGRAFAEPEVWHHVELDAGRNDQPGLLADRIRCSPD